MFVTVKFLREHRTDDSCIRQFEKMWPEGCELTEDNLERAANWGFIFGWFAVNCLPYEAGETYLKLRAGGLRTRVEAMLAAVAVADGEAQRVEVG